MAKKSNCVISIKDLKKIYPEGTEALKGIDLSIHEGEFFGLLGPNGAGKSTTIGVLTSLVQKTSGSVKINGYDIDESLEYSKLQIGVVPQEFNFNIFETCEQIICTQAGYCGIPYEVAKKRARYLLSKLGLEDKTHTPAGKLSGGMKRRLMIARALVHEPKVLILDEPTAGVDIMVRKTMWDFLKELNEKGLTIILTTHYFEEAEELCERIAIIDKGTIIANLPTKQIVSELGIETLDLFCEPCVTEIPRGPFKLSNKSDCSLRAELENDQSVTELIHFLSKHQIKVKKIKTVSNRLEKLFVRLVNL